LHTFDLDRIIVRTKPEIMKSIFRISIFLFLMATVWMFFCSAALLPTEPPLESAFYNDNIQKTKLERLEKKLERVSNPLKKEKIKDKIRKIKYGQEGDALGLAALIAGILSILLCVAVLAFLGIAWQLLVFVGLMLGAAAIIVGIVDLRYTDMPGQAYAAMVAGGLGIVAGIIALIVVK
jgi:hypothetical protein